MTSLTAGIHLSESKTHLPSVGSMISVTEPNEQLVPEWAHHKALLTTRKHFTENELPKERD